MLVLCWVANIIGSLQYSVNMNTVETEPHSRSVFTDKKSVFLLRRNFYNVSPLLNNKVEVLSIALISFQLDNFPKLRTKHCHWSTTNQEANENHVFRTCVTYQ